MIDLKFRSLMNLRSASSRRRRGLDSSRPAWRFTPRLIPLEVRALLSTITVTDDADSGTGSLRAAIADASSGDTIKFAHSAYGTITLTSGPLEVATGVDIDGPGANKVTVSGNDASTVFDVQSGVTATISGLTIAKGSYAVQGTLGAGGIDNDGTLTVSDCVVTGNSVPSGSGASGAGGILSSDTGTLTITGSTVSGNSSPYGGGISSYGPLTISDCTISGNSAAGFGGGINIAGFTSTNTLTVTDSTISGNSASRGGGGISTYAANASLTNCVVSGNSANQGGGINTYNANLNLINCVVSGNAGGGIEITGKIYDNTRISALTITGSAIENNTINQSANSFGVAVGSGIVSNNSDVTVNGSLIANNTAEASQALGGGIAMETDFTPGALNVLTVTDSTFEGNQVIGTGADGFSYGGAIHTDPFATVSLTDSSFLNNSATATYQTQGGALDLEGLAQGTITNSQFTGNQSVVANSTSTDTTATGGAISNTAAFGVSPKGLTISGSTFTNNLAKGGAGGGFGLGGAISNQGFGVTMNLSSSLLAGNSAIGGAGATSGSFSFGGFGGGGALVNNFGAIANVSGSSFIGNIAIGGADTVAGGQAGPGDGGAIQNADATLNVTDSSIAGNVAIGGAASHGATAGDGEGGGIQNLIEGSRIAVTGGTIIGNIAIGGAGGGAGEGGGVYNSGTATFSGVLVTLNSALGGSGGGQGVGGGLYITSGVVTLSNKTKVVGNYATTSNDDIYGPYTTS